MARAGISGELLPVLNPNKRVFDVGSKEVKKRGKRTALVLSQDGKQFWTTQAEFWQWVRTQVVIKTQDHPLTGVFRRADEGRLILLNHTIFNLAAPNHLRESMLARRMIRRSS
jgi:hypothetical protein